MDLFPKEYKKNEPLPGVNGQSTSRLGSFKFKSVNFTALAGLKNLKEPVLRGGIILSGFLLVALVLLWGGLLLYKKSLTNQIIDLKDKQARVFSAQDKAAALDMIGLEKSSALAVSLLKSHVFTSAVLDKLAATTLSQVQWATMDLTVADRSIKARGKAANYSTLAKQIRALEENGFSRVVAGGIMLDKTGGVSFDSSFGFDQKLLLE